MLHRGSCWNSSKHPVKWLNKLLEREQTWILSFISSDRLCASSRLAINSHYEQKCLSIVGTNSRASWNVFGFSSSKMWQTNVELLLLVCAMRFRRNPDWTLLELTSQIARQPMLAVYKCSCCCTDRLVPTFGRFSWLLIKISWTIRNYKYGIIKFLLNLFIKIYLNDSSLNLKSSPGPLRPTRLTVFYNSVGDRRRTSLGSVWLGLFKKTYLSSVIVFNSLAHLFRP